MKKCAWLFVALILLVASPVHAQTEPLDRMWHVGINLGELPFHGSFKPGLQVGYHFNDLAYVGFVYQIPDHIQRDGTSFNAQATGLEGLKSSEEEVGQRMYLQARVRPHRFSPYLSMGFVFNDEDTETMVFDRRARTIGDGVYDDAIVIRQTRPAGLRPALGLGYSFTFDFGLALHTEWSGWWLDGAPEPEIEISGARLSPDDQHALEKRIVDEFTTSPFNSYHVFQVGLGYTF